MSVTEKTPAGTIDLTPTWSATLQVCLIALENGAPEGQRMAREELARMAKLADAYVAMTTKGPEHESGRRVFIFRKGDGVWNIVATSDDDALAQAEERFGRCNWNRESEVFPDRYVWLSDGEPGHQPERFGDDR